MVAAQRVQLAQVNLARLRHPPDSPRLAEFLAAIDRVNALAEDIPTPADAMARLTYLRAHGPTPQAFTVRSRFDPAGRRERTGQLSVPAANQPG
jgi:hypothetical protein